MYTLLRAIVGLHLLMAGAMAFSNPNGGLPTHPAPYLALLLGLMLLVGAATRYTLWAGMLFVAGMVIDRGAYRDWAGLQTQLIYAGLFYVLYAHLTHNRWAADGWFEKMMEPPTLKKASVPVAAPALASASQDSSQNTPVDTALPSPSVVVDEDAGVEGARTTMVQVPADMAALNGSHGAAAADGVEPPGVIALQRATKLLAMHIGPFARIVSRNLQSELGISASELTKLQYEGFVSKMAAQVTDEGKKETFVSNATELGVTLH